MVWAGESERWTKFVSNLVYLLYTCSAPARMAPGLADLFGYYCILLTHYPFKLALPNNFPPLALWWGCLVPASSYKQHITSTAPVFKQVKNISIFILNIQIIYLIWQTCIEHILCQELLCILKNAKETDLSPYSPGSHFCCFHLVYFTAS